jgi:hypothetical protein
MNLAVFDHRQHFGTDRDSYSCGSERAHHEPGSLPDVQPPDPEPVARSRHADLT